MEGAEPPDFGTGPGFAALVVIQGAEADLGAHVVCKDAAVLGRDAEVELPLDDDSISRRHCRVFRDPATNAYRVEDLGSTNGTRVNGAAISRPALLDEGDKIFLGKTIVRFTRADRLDVRFQERLDELVATDALTGLLSKRRFDRSFALAVERANGAGAALAVLVMDMDGLKQINDTHGHEMGGFAIVEVSRILRAVLEPHGEICRFGGDEFVAFLPEHDRNRAWPLAETIRDRVAAHVFEQDGVRVAPTISIGVAALPDDGRTPDELFRTADRALYRAKAAGRNQVAG